MIDHDAAARGKADRVGERGLDLALDLEAVEQGHPAVVVLHLAGALRHHLGDEVPGLPVHLRVVDEDLAHVLAEVVADRADDDVAFLVDEEGRWPLVHRRLDRAPELEQVVEVPLQLFARLPDSGRAHDEPHARRDLQGAQRLAQLRPVLALDPARDPARSRVVGHEHEIAAGEARKGGERGSLPAAFLFFHLDEQLHPFREGVPDGAGLAGPGLLPGVVLARDLLEREEAVPFRPVFDERGFETGLHPGDFPLVDARLALAARGDLDVEVVEELPVHHRDPALLGLGRIDQHSFHGFDPVVCRGPAAASDFGIEAREVARSCPGAHRAGAAVTGRSGRPRSNEAACRPVRRSFAARRAPRGGRFRHLPDAPGGSSWRSPERSGPAPRDAIGASRRHGSSCLAPRSGRASGSIRGSGCLNSEPLGCPASSSSISTPLRP